MISKINLFLKKLNKSRLPSFGSLALVLFSGFLIVGSGLFLLSAQINQTGESALEFLNKQQQEKFGLSLFGKTASAQSVEEIKRKIRDRNQTIQELEKEIAEYRAEAEKVSKQKNTLKSAVQELELSSRKLATDIRATENKIDASELTIEQLELELELYGQRIEQDKDVIAKTIKKLNEFESQTLLESLLAHDNISDFWDEIESLERFKVGVKTNLESLKETQEKLAQNKEQILGTVDNLEVLKSELASKRGAVEVNRSEKDELLRVTANKEANYQSLIAEKEAKREAFLAELKAFEASLNIDVDKTKIPTAGPGVLKWPLDNITITQHFGNTAFAQSGAYNGSGHNGMDFSASVGTPVKASLSGVVQALGDTDTACRNASYGKWILIRHYNGLTTLYAHLSGFNVSVGQEVGTGAVIGYSGNTGYSTGPHLHFTVYATEGVRVVQRPSRACGGAVYTMPVADLEAYLNPLSFL